MIYYLLLMVSILLTVFKSSLYNTYAKKTNPSLFFVFVFNAISYGAAALVGLISLFIWQSPVSLPTIVCALIYACVVVSLQTVSIVAMKLGALSMTALFVMYGMIIPSLAGPLFWGEPFGILQGVGITMMVASLWLLRDKSEKGETEKADKSSSFIKWIILAIVAFLLSGMAGVMEKIHQSTNGKDEKTAFVFIACLFMLIFSSLGGLVTHKNRGSALSRKPLLIFGLISGIVIGLYSLVNLTLAGNLDSMIYYPVANGGAMLLTVIISFTVFKEKTTMEKIIGTAIGLIGIIALSLPI